MTQRKPFSDRTQQLCVIGLFILATIALVGSMILTDHGKEVPDFVGYAFATMITGLGVPLGMNMLSQTRPPSDKL